MYVITVDDCSAHNDKSCDDCTKNDTVSIKFKMLLERIFVEHTSRILHSRVWYFLCSVTGVIPIRNAENGNGRVGTYCQLALTAVATTGITNHAQVSQHLLYDLMCTMMYAICHHGRGGVW